MQMPNRWYENCPHCAGSGAYYAEKIIEATPHSMKTETSISKKIQNSLNRMNSRNETIKEKHLPFLNKSLEALTSDAFTQQSIDLVKVLFRLRKGLHLAAVKRNFRQDLKNHGFPVQAISIGHPKSWQERLVEEAFGMDKKWFFRIDLDGDLNFTAGGKKYLKFSKQRLNDVITVMQSDALAFSSPTSFSFDKIFDKEKKKLQLDSTNQLAVDIEITDSRFLFLLDKNLLSAMFNDIIRQFQNINDWWLFN